MKNFRWLAGAAAVLALAGNYASADVITNIPVKDAGMYIIPCDGRTSRGGAPRIECTVATNVPGASGDGSLIKFDLRPGGVSVIPAGHIITNAQLRLRSYSGNNARWKHYVLAYPLQADWGEGVAGAYSGALPWFPTSVGDATPLYSNVTEIDTCTNLFYNLGVAISTNDWASWKASTNLIAKAGTLWNVFGGRGIGTDVANRKMMDYLWINELYPNTKNYGSTGGYLPSLSFTEEGVKVISEWAAGTLVNHGFNIWGVCPPNNMLTNVNVTARYGSREPLTVGGATYPPELVLFTAMPPSPRTLLIFR